MVNGINTETDVTLSACTHLPTMHHWKHLVLTSTAVATLSFVVLLLAYVVPRWNIIVHMYHHLNADESVRWFPGSRNQISSLTLAKYFSHKGSFQIPKHSYHPDIGRDGDLTAYQGNTEFRLPEEICNTGSISVHNEEEALASLQLAISFRNQGKEKKADKLFKHALALRPTHPDILTQYGIFLEQVRHDIVNAEHHYLRALLYRPDHELAAKQRQRALPLVEKHDFELLQHIDRTREFFLNIPKESPALKRAKHEAYFQHIHHTVAIEGNTMSLIQTRVVLETRMAIAGKSIIEHNEILGMDSAFRFLDETLVNRIGHITLLDIMEIHKRVLGHVDPLEAGQYRRTQVYVGSFHPVGASSIPQEMNEFINWFNSEEALSLHPVELAALVHYKFVFIHPYIDGNGRTARLLMNLILMQAGFPPVIIRVDDRLRYYETLKLANEGDLRPFIRFVAACAERTLQEYLSQTTELPGAADRAHVPELDAYGRHVFEDDGRTIVLGEEDDED